MTLFSPPTAWAIRPNWPRVLGRPLLVAMLAGASAVTAVAETLLPYTAEYRTTARGLKLDLSRQLSVSPAGDYTLTNGGKVMVVGFQETSQFSLEGEKIVPRSYVYQGTGLMNRRREVQFTPGAKTLRSLYKDKWYELPNESGTLDRMSQQEQLRLSLLNDDTPREDVSVIVADGKRIKRYELNYVGQETITTELGAVETLHFERVHDDPDRKSDTWLAPEWGYLLVKAVHIEDGKPVEMIITAAAIDGKPVGAGP